MRAALLALLAALAAGCAMPPAGPASGAPGARPAAAAPGAARYACEQGLQLRLAVDAAAETAQLDAGPLGSDTLLRDAGGEGPGQAVYSSTRFRLALGLEPDGRGALLNQAEPPLALRCERAG